MERAEKSLDKKTGPGSSELEENGHDTPLFSGLWSKISGTGYSSSK
jgi:hypothetical protein